MENYFKVTYQENIKKNRKCLENIIYQNNFTNINSKINDNIFEKVDNLINIKSEERNLESLFIYGKDGVGKYTIAKYCVKNYINNSITDNLEEKVFEIDNKVLIYFKSKFHYEIIINKYNFTDLNLITNFLNEILVKNIKITGNYKKNIIIFKNINLLRVNIFRFLKTYIEKNYILNIFILISNNNIPNSFKGLLIPIYINISPKKKFINLGKKILEKENIEFKKKELDYIYSICDNSLNKFKNILELSYINGTYEKYKDVIDTKLKFIVKLIKKKNSEYILMIREIINDLLVDNYDYKNILKFLLKSFNTDPNINLILNEIVKCDENISKCYRKLHHLEFLIIRIINIHNN